MYYLAQTKRTYFDVRLINNKFQLVECSYTGKVIRCWEPQSREELCVAQLEGIASIRTEIKVNN